MPSVQVAKDDGSILLDFDLKPGRGYLIGRSEEADIRLKAQSISRLHALIYMKQGAWHITDLGSTKGLKTDSGVVRDLTLREGEHEWVRIGPASIWYFLNRDDAEENSPDPDQENRKLVMLKIRHRDTGEESFIGLIRNAITFGTATSSFDP